ncbi:MAG: hypothetical protein NXY57DRAFT_96388 [Lentinula lateritia]|nr:MAG: hypothetical protein NXY57DRAFT_96388 [Lentinula lateritia]
MFTMKFSVIVSMSLTYLFGAFASNLTTDAVVPVSGTNMGSIQLPNGDTRLYYQDQHNGSIIEMVISNAFTIGVFEESAVLVPASQVRSNSPVAVSLVADGDTFVQVHTFFFSPENVLSQYYWDDVLGIQGGANCLTCVTNKGFVGVAGSQMLYAMASSATSPPTLRVGFVSAGAPNTISEAVNTGSGWSVASLST